MEVYKLYEHCGQQKLQLYKLYFRLTFLKYFLNRLLNKQFALVRNNLDSLIHGNEPVNDFQANIQFS